MTEPFLFLYGNCQMGRIAEGLRMQPGVSRMFNVRRVQNFKDFDDEVSDAHRKRIDEFEREAGNCKVFIYQAEAWDKNSRVITEKLPADCIRVPLFSISLPTFWPFYFKDAAIRKGRTGGISPDYFPCGDSFLTRRIKAGAAFEDIVQEYLALDVNCVVPLDAWRDANLANLRQKEQGSVMRISDYVDERFATERCFWVLNHPTNSVIRVVVDQVLEALELNVMDKETGDEFAAKPGLGSIIDHPVHPSIIEHFGLTYLGPDHRYKHYEQSLSFEAWTRLYVTTAMQVHGPAAADRTRSAAG